MKTSTLIPVVAYLGLAGYTSAAPVAVDAGHALDKRTFCIFGFGWGCNTAPAPVPAPKPAPSAASSSVKAAVSSASAVKSSSAVVASSSAKAVSSAAASSSAKAVVPTSSAVTKTSSASWAACTDFDWNAWGSDWTWGGGFDKDYVKAWYVDQYGFAPPAGMNWRQVSSLVSKFGQKTKPASPKTTSKYTGGKCANPWTSAVNTKTQAPVTTSKAAASSAAASKPVVTSVASSAAVSKPAASVPASSAAASSSKAAAPASSSASVVVGGPASGASSAVVVQPAPSVASSVVVQPAPSVASSSVVQPASSAAPSASADPVVASPSPSPAGSSAVSSAAASPAASSDAASTPAASASAGTGSSDGGAGVPGTGAGIPGTGAGSNNATGTVAAETPIATAPAAVVINGFTYGGCAQEVTGRLLADVQTSSSSQTIESCTALCSSYGYAVAGLEYGNECYCGTLEDIEDVKVSGECYMPCSGDANQICGGPNAINYYVDADLVPATVQLPAGWSTYGVVSEGQNGRLLPVQIYSGSDNTVESCAAKCAGAGFSIAGTEYSSECFCGNHFEASANGGQLLDDSAAFMSCAGNLAQKCGGPSVLSVTSAFGNNIPSA